MNYIADNIRNIQDSMAAACQRAGREAHEVELMIVSKTFPPELIREAVAYPHRLFGENRVQEALEKIPQLLSHLRWHLIGSLQKNKVRKILPHVECIQSVDSLDLAQAIQRIAEEEGLRSQIYLQVNVAEDAAKHGFTADSVRPALEEIMKLDRLTVQGLMTIPALVPEPEKSRPHFAALRKLRDAIQSEFGLPSLGLSMGMSGDFPVAIEEGSTLVRVGSAIFGRR